jgi:hypothetical protein
MKKPDEFHAWCEKSNIAPKSHDYSIAWASWQECYYFMLKKIAEKNTKETGARYDRIKKSEYPEKDWGKRVQQTKEDAKPPIQVTCGGGKGWSESKDNPVW